MSSNLKAYYGSESFVTGGLSLEQADAVLANYAVNGLSTAQGLEQFNQAMDDLLRYHADATFHIGVLSTGLENHTYSTQYAASAARSLRTLDRVLGVDVVTVSVEHYSEDNLSLFYRHSLEGFKDRLSTIVSYMKQLPMKIKESVQYFFSSERVHDALVRKAEHIGKELAKKDPTVGVTVSMPPSFNLAGTPITDLKVALADDHRAMNYLFDKYAPGVVGYALKVATIAEESIDRTTGIEKDLTKAVKLTHPRALLGDEKMLKLMGYAVNSDVTNTQIGLISQVERIEDIVISKPFTETKTSPYTLPHGVAEVEKCIDNIKAYAQMYLTARREMKAELTRIERRLTVLVDQIDRTVARVSGDGSDQIDKPANHNEALREKMMDLVQYVCNDIVYTVPVLTKMAVTKSERLLAHAETVTKALPNKT